MPWNDYEDQLRRTGQQIQDTTADAIKTHLDDPIAAKLQALRQLSQQNAPQSQQAPQGVPGVAPGGSAAIMGIKQPMPSQAQQQGAIANAEMWQRIRQRDDAMKQQLMQQAQEQAQHEAEFDPSQYKEYQRSNNVGDAISKHVFPKIADAIKKRKAGDALEKEFDQQSDIRDQLRAKGGGMVEVTPELEKQLGLGTPDEEEDK